ncbi:uncharacterized protein LOC141639407 [Silene latifolia]|uniref:uncharacterized protein LOC141639407 n=1 Tax=Silene latifolia TaxID=37657 RepID=UPI003D76BFC3
MATPTREQNQEFCRILVLTEEGKAIGMGTPLTNSQSGSRLQSPDSVDAMGNSDPFPPFVVTVDIEQGCTDGPNINQDTCGTIKTDVALTKPLRRQNSLQIGGSIPPLMNHILMLLKFDAKDKQGLERSHDGAYNRWKKCKRPNLFDSRRIVILFSILSSMGTLVLIYLTLRVRQVSDGYIHG